MNTTTLNMTTLDGGIIIKRGEGGGSTPPSGGSSWRYFDLKALRANAKYVLDPFFLVKGKVGSGSPTIISPTQLFISESNAEIYAAATDESVDWVIDSGDKISASVLLAQILPQIQSMGAVEITKEQFYDLNA